MTTPNNEFEDTNIGKNRKKIKPTSMNFIVPLVIYPFDIMVSFGETNEQVEKNLKSKGILSDEDIELAMFRTETVNGRAVMFESNQSFIRLRQIPVIPNDFGKLQHEIFHVVHFIMDRVGMKYETMVSDEAYAYLTGYITEQIYLKIFAHTIRK